MNGSEKQINWANDIRNGKAQEFEKLIGAATNDIARNAIAYIRDNECAAFWIDYRDTKPIDMFHSLFKGTLMIEGYSGFITAKLDPQTGEISETRRNPLA